MRNILLILLFFCFQFIYAQDLIKEIFSINFKNSSKVNVIKQVEKLTEYRFYFVEEWLDDEPISGEYSNVTINTLLDLIFNNTIINYYITSDNKIILSRSVLIYSSLPDGFFGESEKEISQSQKAWAGCWQ